MAAYFAQDYNAFAPPQMQEANVEVVREFQFVVNSTVAGNPNVVSTLGIGDTIQLCTLPGQNYGITIDDYYFDFGKLDTNGAPTLVFSLGTLLLALDPGSVSSAAAGQFATLITPNTATDTRLNQLAYLSNAATPVLLPVTYPVNALPFSITNQPGPTQSPNSGLYDLLITVTAAAATVSAVNAFGRGYIKYHTIGQVGNV